MAKWKGTQVKEKSRLVKCWWSSSKARRKEGQQPKSKVAVRFFEWGEMDCKCLVIVAKIRWTEPLFWVLPVKEGLIRQRYRAPVTTPLWGSAHFFGSHKTSYLNSYEGGATFNNFLLTFNYSLESQNLPSLNLHKKKKSGTWLLKSTYYITIIT